MKTFCVFHKIDLDGMSSAAIVKYFRPNLIFKPFNYNDPFPFKPNELKPEDKVFFVDVAIQPYTEMMRIYEIVGTNLHIMDHHKSFLESPTGLELKEKLGSNFHCSTKEAGCELTWSFFSKSSTPRAIRLLGQYDAWRDTEEKKLAFDTDWDTVMAFQMGMRQKKFNTDDFISNYLDESFLNRYVIDETIEQGQVILAYQNNQNDISMNHSFDEIIIGPDESGKPREFKCLVLNTGMKNSQVFKSKWDANKYDFMVAFSYGKDRKWSWSFYTDKPGMDASKLASQFGGGGHVGAAGCITEDFIFD